MPKFTIERTFDVPTYRQETYEAPDLKTALEMDAQNDNWDEQKQDYDNCGDERVTGVWAGETAYEGENLHGNALGIEEEEAAVIRALIALDGAASDEAEVNHG